MKSKKIIVNIIAKYIATGKIVLKGAGFEQKNIGKYIICFLPS
jgi:hypothetical protein